MIKDELYRLQDVSYRSFSLKLLPKGTPLIGVRLPVLRRLSKTVRLEELSDDSFEEVMLQGMIIGHIQDFSEFQEKCLLFLPKINNWSICDSFVCGLVIAKKYPEEMFSFLKTLVGCYEEYIRRFVLVMMIHYYVNDDLYEKVEEILREISKDGYFVQMACAWLIAEVYCFKPELALAILKKPMYNLDKFIFQKSIAKIKESRKVSQQEKRKLTDFRNQYLKNFY